MQSDLQAKAQLVEAHLDELLDKKDLSYRSLFQAARYSLLESGGKRLRPILMLTTAEDLKQDTQKVLPIAAALEMIHTYSLIHDDLPCMDDDDFRRGLPSLHKAFSEWQALLTGDFLLTFAFEILTKSIYLSDAQKVKLIALFASKSGACGLIGGQVVDLLKTGKITSAEELAFIHELKTASLIEVAILAAAIIGEVDTILYKQLEMFAKKIGLAYQVIDDVLDVSGKQSDVANNKITYASLLGLEPAKAFAQSLYQEAIQILDLTESKMPKLKELAYFLIHRNI